MERSKPPILCCLPLPRKSVASCLVCGSHTQRVTSGGPLALLKNSPESDVMFLAHTGLELGTYLQAARGGLMRKELHIRLWRVPREEIPESDEDRIDWLYEQWGQVDKWIGNKRDSH